MTSKVELKKSFVTNGFKTSNCKKITYSGSYLVVPSKVKVLQMASKVLIATWAPNGLLLGSKRAPNGLKWARNVPVATKVPMAKKVPMPTKWSLAVLASYEIWACFQKKVYLQGFWSKSVKCFWNQYCSKLSLRGLEKGIKEWIHKGIQKDHNFQKLHLQGRSKSAYLKCFGNQFKTVYLQGPQTSRPRISRPCCFNF